MVPTKLSREPVRDQSEDISSLDWDKSVVKVNQSVQHPVLRVPEIVAALVIQPQERALRPPTHRRAVGTGRQGTVRRREAEIRGETVRWRGEGGF